MPCHSDGSMSAMRRTLPIIECTAYPGRSAARTRRLAKENASWTSTA